MHTLLPFLLAMVVAIVLLNVWATKLKIAYPVLLVVGGLVVSFLPGLPRLKINPDLIFFLFLPPLLFEASWTISFKEMKKWWRMIGSFAFLVVFFSASLVAMAATQFIPGFTIALGFLLGGIVSPPDAVSIGVVTKFIKIPKFTSAILQGESLLNDASSLIIFRFAVVAVSTSQFIWQQAALSFLWTVLGGAGAGLLLAWLFVQAHKRLPLDGSFSPASIASVPSFQQALANALTNGLDRYAWCRLAGVGLSDTRHVEQRPGVSPTEPYSVYHLCCDPTHAPGAGTHASLLYHPVKVVRRPDG